VDNGGRPVTFSPPSEIDGSVSATGFACTSTSSSGGFSLILGPQGLYVFTGGGLSQLPMSNYQSPLWDDLIWTGSYAPRIAAKDFSTERLIVASVVGPAGFGKIFTWSYEDGLTPDKAKFSPWTCADANGFFITPGPNFEIARKGGIWQLFLVANALVAGSQTSAMVRMQSLQAGDSAANLYKDFWGVSFAATGIDWQYQTAPLPRLDDQPMLQHLALRIRALALTGTPAIYISAKSLDNVRTITLPLSPITLSTAPGKEYLALYDAQEECVSYLFTNNNVSGAGIAVARFTHFYNFFAEQR
jgi:hypothetical protein